MALRDQPYLPLYIQDFLTDEKLAECSAAATGVYIRLMCLMHKSEEYGKILLKQKHKQSKNQVVNFASQIAKQMPFDFHTVTNALEELLSEKVIVMEGDVVIQKRMVKDSILSETRAKSGKKGGDKSLGKGDKNDVDFAQANAQANLQANIEYENEYENKERDIGGVGEKEKDEYSFDQFWNDYDKKVGDKEKLKRKWDKIKESDKLLIKFHILKYKISEPNKKFRKNPETYLNNHSWNDEIINDEKNNSNQRSNSSSYQRKQEFTEHIARKLANGDS